MISSELNKIVKQKWLNRWLSSLNTPSYKQIWVAIDRNRQLLVLTLLGNTLSAVLETATFGIIFLSLGVLQGNQLPALPNQLKSALPWLSTMWAWNNQTVFSILISLIVFLQLARSVMSYFSQIAAGDLAARINAQMTEVVFTRILSFSFPFASRYKIGDLTNYVGQAGPSVDVQIRYYNQLLTAVLLVFAYSTTVITISVHLSAVALLAFTALIFLQRWLLPRITETSIKLSHANVEASQEIVENIQALRVVHTFGRQVATINRIKQQQQHVLAFLKQQVRLMSLLAPINSALTILVVAALLIVGAFMLRQEQGSVLPMIATFILSLNRLSAQIQLIAATLNNIAENSGRILRLDAILQPNFQILNHSDGTRFKGLKSQISFEKICLQYDEASHPVLLDVSFELPKKSLIALVGESGSGKSSIVDILIGLYEPTSGGILVDGFDLRSYNKESWRERLGVVSQDTFIFNQSILENIRYGLPQATDAEVREAARQAQAQNFIESMPHGYETIVGERGYRLSGGQRQRIALARAILKQPEVLILDEATSALDSETERLVQQALNQFGRDRTLLVVAHRLSTIVQADQILVLDQGKVVERGKHNDLLLLDGKYARYWEIQSNTQKGMMS